MSDAIKTPDTPKPEVKTVRQIVSDALRAAGRGGLAGAAAQAVNVLALMWLRTIMNYQYRYGGTAIGTMKLLWREGGIPRFYRGLIPALCQAPLSRFGDTAGNAGALAFLDSFDSTKDLPIAVKTLFASASAASFRALLMPVDAWKTTKQVEGEAGMKVLIEGVKKQGIRRLWQGTLASVAATAVGHYPWFFTYNYCKKNMPQFEFTYGKYVREALIGFMAAVVSDCISNSLRVVKTAKQTHKEAVSYVQVLKEVVAKDSWAGVFGRGLKTRIFTNGLQGMLFTVMWKGFQDALERRSKQKEIKLNNTISPGKQN